MKVNPINPIDETRFNIKPNQKPNRHQDNKEKKKSDFRDK